MESKQTAVDWLFEQLEEKGDARETSSIRNIQFNLDTSDYLELKRIAKEMEKEQCKITEETSDGFHTFKELYNVRMALNAALFNQWAGTSQRKWTEEKRCFETLPINHVHKSWRHNTGELCFGGGWFIVCAKTSHGQISFHYPASEWEYFNIPEVEKAIHEFDGHTTEQVIARLLNI
jgi:hypothetical protein